MRQGGRLISAQDFEPNPGESQERLIVANIALPYYEEHREPVGKLLIQEVKRYCRREGIGDRAAEKTIKYAQKLVRGSLPSGTFITERLQEFHSSKIKEAAMREMAQLFRVGKLDDEKWLELTQKGTLGRTTTRRVTDYFEGLDERVQRRIKGHNHYPLFFIPPLDVLTKGIGNGHLGLVMARTSGGKSLFLIWLAMAYAAQGRRVMFVTLEDPLSDVEDRFDAAITHVPVLDLSQRTRQVRLMFQRFRSQVRGRVKIVDGTDGGMSVKEVMGQWEALRREGFVADSIIIDYDAELRAPNIRAERHEQYEAVYTQLRELAAQCQAIVWTATQATREAEDLKVIKVRHTEGSIWKDRKSTMVLSLGRAEDTWGPDAAYLYVVKQRTGGRAGVGCYIVGNYPRTLIYDAVKTRRAYEKLGVGTRNGKHHHEDDA